MTEELKQLEKILDLQFEAYDYKKEQSNTYQGYGNIRELRITGREFNLDVLLPFKDELCQLHLTDCTIDSFAGLAQLDLNEIHFDNVTVLKGEKALKPLFDHMPVMDPRLHVYLKNMHLEFPAEILHAGRRLDHLFIRNCTISNFYEINLLPHLYDLRLTNVIIRQTQEDIVHQPLPDRHFIRICLDEMNLENLDVFLPISENVTHIELTNSRIGSIRNIHRFEKLDLFEIDAETRIEDTEFEPDPSIDFYMETCQIGSVLSYASVPEEFSSFDLQQLGSVAHFIKSFHFQGTLVHNTDWLKHFTRLESLEFEKCTAQLTRFLPVAHQLKTLSFDEAKVIDWECIQAFTQLERIKTSSNWEVKMIGDLTVLLPIKNQLKELDLYEEHVQNVELIREFTALELLELRDLDSVETAKNVLSLGSLKKLQWRFYLEDGEEKPEEPVVFDVSGLKSIRELEFSSDFVSITGIGQLTELVKLELGCDCEIEQLPRLKKLEYLEICSGEVNDVNKISRMESLKTLVLSVEEDHKVHSLEQFPNLEKLRFDGGGKQVRIGKLNALKLFIPDEIDLENAAWLGDLPNLERLCLQYQEIYSLQNLDKLIHLKMLDLSENKLESIKGLENLEKLEYLNLYDNRLSDIRILNLLPNLKEVNLAGNELEDEELRKQLDRPEIARFLYRPYAPFSIRIDRDYDEDDL